MKYGFKEIMCH